MVNDIYLLDVLEPVRVTLDDLNLLKVPCNVSLWDVNLNKTASYMSSLIIKIY